MGTRALYIANSAECLAFARLKDDSVSWVLPGLNWRVDPVRCSTVSCQLAMEIPLILFLCVTPVLHLSPSQNGQNATST